MRELLLFMLISSSLGLMLGGLLSRPGQYQYPFLAGAVFAGWLVPQAIGLYGNQILPEGGYERTLFMAVLCVVAIYVGNVSCRKPWRSFAWQLDDRRLLIGATALSVFGYFFNLLIMELPAEQLGRQWTGIATIYYFFSQAQIFGYAIAAILYARTRRLLALALAALNLVFYTEVILYAARRGLAIDIGLITLLALWFGRGWVMPRVLMVSGAVVAMLLVFNISAIRQIGYDSAGYGVGGGHILSMEELSNIDFVGKFNEILSKGSEELTNAIYDMSAAAESGTYDFGQSYWNAFVFRYVPAQFLGRDIKESLMFDLPESAAKDMFGYRRTPGATPTGLSDSFAAFWFFGAGVFFVISRIMATLYLAAVRQHRIAQILYLVSITSALQAITHVSWWFFTPWIQYFMFLLPVFVWARVKGVSVRQSAALGLREQPIGTSQEILRRKIAR
jgi:hypothetical protein